MGTKQLLREILQRLTRVEDLLARRAPRGEPDSAVRGWMDSAMADILSYQAGGGRKGED